MTSRRPSQASDESPSPDAATLGFADLAELPPGGELPEFRDLRSRLFGDIDIDEPDLDRLPPPPVPFIPAQTSFANGAPTAAEIAASTPIEVEPDDADVDVDDADEPDEPLEPDEPEEQSWSPAFLESAFVQQAPADDDVEADPEPLPEPTPTAEHRPPPPPGVAADPAPPGSPRSKAPLAALMAVFVAASIVGCWFLLSRNGGQGASSEDPSAVSQATRAQIVATTRIDDDTLRITQQLDFDSEIGSLRLRVPAGAAGTATSDFDLEISDVQILVDGQPVQRLGAPLASGTATSVALDNPADSMTISYVADNAVVRTEPSSAHRAKALLTPLVIGAADGSTRTITVRGGDILNVGCATRTEAVACGEKGDDGWTVSTSDGSTAVIAQLDLPD